MSHASKRTILIVFDEQSGISAWPVTVDRTSSKLAEQIHSSRDWGKNPDHVNRGKQHYSKRKEKSAGGRGDSEEWRVTGVHQTQRLGSCY